MKKLYTLFAVAFVGFIGNAQIVNIPDANFKAKLIFLGVDTNADGEIQQAEALVKTNLELDSSNIYNLTGINEFANLEYLNFSSNNVSNLTPVNGLNHLISLIFVENNVSSLATLNNLPALTNLECSNNPLSSLLGIGNLPLLETLTCELCPNLTSLSEISVYPNIKNLYCSYNAQIPLSTLSAATNLTTLSWVGMGLTSLDPISGLNNLTNLDVQFNNLSVINLSYFPNLAFFNCYGNNLVNLDLAPAPNLVSLVCDGNHITNLNLPPLVHLTQLSCADNTISSLNFSQTPNLTSVTCSYNNLSNLDLSGISHLSFLDCSYNVLNVLDVSGFQDLAYIDCSGNNLSTLDVSDQLQLSELHCNEMSSLISVFMKNGSTNYNIVNPFTCENSNNLTYICTDDFYVTFIQDYVAAAIGLNCHVNSYCSFTPSGTFYTIQGNNHYDVNNNGCDAADISYPNLKLTFANGLNSSTFFANNTGSYHYDVEAGIHSVTPTLENQAYFSISPANFNVNFPSNVNPFIQNFCISPNGTHNDLEVTILPIDSARPGFDTSYKIIYKNKGTQSQSGSLSFDYYDPIEDFISANPIISSQGTNTLIWNFSNLLPFETREITVTFNLNSPLETPAVNAGNLIAYSATITGAIDETLVDNTSSLTQTVVNSYDPNDKTCIEGTALPVYEVGKYLHYIIRFENNGTANAQNIVVKDVIDTTKLDVSTLIPLSGSHPFETKISSTNKVEFIFQNINLPFDDANNDGYVAFKIKTLPTLVEGNVINNAANIYFDYNAPITTNTNTVNIFNPLATPDFDFGSVFTLSPIPAKNNLTITTKQDVEMTSASIYNMLGQLIQVVTDPNETIDVSGLKEGSYFIKIISNKGTASSKFVKE